MSTEISADRPDRKAALHHERACDALMSISDIRVLFKVGRTAAYELTHRPGFPEPIQISPRCYRWWASQVRAYAAGLQEMPPRRPPTARPATPSAGQPDRRIVGRTRAVRARKEPE